MSHLANTVSRSEVWQPVTRPALHTNTCSDHVFTATQHCYCTVAVGTGLGPTPQSFSNSSSFLAVFLSALFLTTRRPSTPSGPAHFANPCPAPCPPSCPNISPPSLFLPTATRNTG